MPSARTTPLKTKRLKTKRLTGGAIALLPPAAQSPDSRPMSYREILSFQPDNAAPYRISGDFCGSDNRVTAAAQFGLPAPIPSRPIPPLAPPDTLLLPDASARIANRQDRAP